MRARFRVEVRASTAWPPGLGEVLPVATRVPVRLIVTPFSEPRRLVRGADADFQRVVYAREPSAVEAALWIAAGVNAYVTTLVDVPTALRAVESGDAWFARPAAVALHRLAQLSALPALDVLAAAARATAMGLDWSSACHAADLRNAVALLTLLRQHLWLSEEAN